MKNIVKTQKVAVKARFYLPNIFQLFHIAKQKICQKICEKLENQNSLAIKLWWFRDGQVKPIALVEGFPEALQWGDFFSILP